MKKETFMRTFDELKNKYGDFYFSHFKTPDIKLIDMEKLKTIYYEFHTFILENTSYDNNPHFSDSYDFLGYEQGAKYCGEFNKIHFHLLRLQSNTKLDDGVIE